MSKVFLLHHWDPVFGPVSRDPRILAAVADLLGPRPRLLPVAVHLQEPGGDRPALAPGLLLLPVRAGPPGRRLARGHRRRPPTTAPSGSCPARTGRPVHDHVPDTRESANFGYVEIVDHDMGAEVCVLMEPGDLLVFDSHLMHRSTDNGSDGLRAAMVYHYGVAGTVDRTGEALSVERRRPRRHPGGRRRPPRARQDRQLLPVDPRPPRGRGRVPDHRHSGPDGRA